MLSDLTHIPRIMRKQGWVNGATLLETWFRRAKSVAPTYTAPEVSTIKMDTWALGFPRARQVYDQLIRDRIWVTTPARPVVAKMLRDKGLIQPTPKAFGQLAAPVPQQHPDYINYRTAGGYTAFDDMTAALGNFDFRVVVAGTVAPVGGGKPGHLVTIDEVGVYIQDSFDFNGDQYLGCWGDDPDGFTPLMPPDPAAMEGGFSFQPPMFSPVGNRDFRDWRDRNGKGGDFLVFSDMKRVPLSTPDTFVI